jgi:hypothetical protein
MIPGAIVKPVVKATVKAGQGWSRLNISWTSLTNLLTFKCHP